MTSPSLELQKAIVAHISADPAIMAKITKVYDRVQSSASGVVFPYVSWGTEQYITDDAQCIDGAEVFIEIDVWSREPGYTEVKTITDMIKRRMHRADLLLAGAALVQIEVDNIRYERAADGNTSQGRISLRALIEE